MRGSPAGAGWAGLGSRSRARTTLLERMLWGGNSEWNRLGSLVCNFLYVFGLPRGADFVG